MSDSGVPDELWLKSITSEELVSGIKRALEALIQEHPETQPFQKAIMAETQVLRNALHNLLEDISKRFADQAKINADQAKISADQGQTIADQAKINADQAKINADQGQTIADQGQTIAIMRQDINMISDRDTLDRFTNRRLSKVTCAGQDVAVYEMKLIEPLNIWRHNVRRLEGNRLAHGGQSLKRTHELLSEIGETTDLPQHFNDQDPNFRVETLSGVAKLCTMSSSEETDDIISK